MQDAGWTFGNVDDLTRQAFQLLAAQTGLNEAQFLRVLVVEYAVTKVLNVKANSPASVESAAPIVQPQVHRHSVKKIRLKSRASASEIEGGPTSDEITDWMRRLDAKKNLPNRRSAFGLGLLQAI